MNIVRKSWIYLVVWIFIACVPKPKPLVAEDITVSTPQDMAVDISLSVTGADPTKLTYELGVPANGTLSGTGPAVTYTPSPSYRGPDLFTYAASNGRVTSNSATVNINVTAPLFPIRLIGPAPEQASISFNTRKPAGATTAVVTITAYDADFPNEGALVVNSNPPVALFGTSGVAANSDKSVAIVLNVPASQWRDGSNSIVFRHTSTSGFIIEGMKVAFQ